MREVSKKKKRWTHPRHGIVRNIAFFVMKPYINLRYNIKIEPFTQQGDRPYLILLNHQTPFDQFFVGLSFKGPVYYLATEDIFSLGIISKLICWLIAPIPIKKQTTDVGAVMTLIRVSKEGGTIALAPEGNRTYSGRTEYMNPAIGALIKKLRMPVALYRVEGGYGAEPRWSDKRRKGPMRAYVSKVIEPEELAELTNEEVFGLVKEGLFVDEAVADAEYISEKRAEYLERAVYICPFCGFAEFRSQGNEIECTKCRRKVTYGTDKTLTGNGFSFPFKFAADWYDYQKDYINSHDTTALTAKPVFSDRANVSEVILYKKKNLLKKMAAVDLYGDRLVIDKAETIPFSEISVAACLGHNKLNIYHNDKVYQFKGDNRFNSLKYVHLVYRYKNVVKGEENGQFLGL